MFEMFHNKMLGAGNIVFEMILKREMGEGRKKKGKTKNNNALVTTAQAGTNSSHEQSHLKVHSKSEHSCPTFSEGTMSQADPLALPSELKLAVVKGLVKLENQHFVI